MNARDDIGTLIRRHYVAVADSHVSDGRLDRILTQTSAITPRSGWLVRVRDVSTSDVVPPIDRRRVGWLGVALLLIALAIVAAVASQRPPQLDLGLLAFTQDGDVYVAAADGSAAVLVAHDDSTPLHLRGWSPNGRLLALESEGPGTFVLDIRTGLLHRATDGGFIAWAGDSRSFLADAWPTGPRWVGLDGSVGEPLTQTRVTLPTPSPDGTLIAGVADGQLVIVDLPSGTIRTVAPAGGYGFGYSSGSGWDFPSWSPDSAHIAFVMEATGSEPQIGAGGRSVIAIVDRDGNGLRVLEPTIGDSGRPAWSPDGNAIAYAIGGTLHVIRPDATEDRTLVDGLIHGRYGTNPYGTGGYWWNPASQVITIFRERPDAGLGPWQVDVTSGGLRPLVVPDHEPEALAWQTVPRGEPVASPPAVASIAPPASSEPIRIALPADPVDPALEWRALALDIYAAAGACAGAMFDLRAATVEILVPRCWTGRSLGWSPDANLHAGVTGGEAIEVTDRLGMVVATISGGWSSVGNSGWSPSGGWIWIQGCAGQDQDCASVDFIVRPDGSGLRHVPGMPLWSADGQRLAIAAPDGTVLVGAGDGSDLRSIGAFPAPAAWSPDATRLAYLQAGDAWVVNADGSSARNVTQFALPIATAVSWSPVADRLAVTQGRLVWLVGVDGGETRSVDLGGTSPSVRWSPDGSAFIADCLGPAYPSSSGVWCVVPTDGGRPVMLDGDQLVDPIWSPDSRYVVLTTNEASASRLLAFRADGSGRTRLDVGGEPASPARWLP